MKKILLPGLIAGALLLGLSFGTLFLAVRFLPDLMAEYFNPVFRTGEERAPLFYAHPFILSFALAWFWERFKDSFRGGFVLRALELALVYGIVATLPSMWITFSAIDVSMAMVGSWFLYGILQAFVAGLIFSKMNP